MSSILLDQPTINNIKSDTLQFGIALMLSHFFAGKSFVSLKAKNTSIVAY